MTLNPMVVNAVIASREFDLPCQANRAELSPCEQPAKWGLWLSHTRGGCGVTSNVCDFHKRTLEFLWPRMLGMWPDEGTCPQCGGGSTNRLDDNVRFIPL